MDLGALYTGDLSLRRLRILIKFLPSDAKLAKLIAVRRRAAGIVSDARIEDADPSVWSQTEWMLVHLHDQLTLIHYLLHKANFKPGPKPPRFMPRPGTEPVRRRTLNAWFGAVGLPPQTRTT